MIWNIFWQGIIHITTPTYDSPVFCPFQIYSASWLLNKNMIFGKDPLTLVVLNIWDCFFFFYSRVHPGAAVGCVSAIRVHPGAALQGFVHPKSTLHRIWPSWLEQTWFGESPFIYFVQNLLCPVCPSWL